MPKATKRLSRARTTRKSGRGTVLPKINTMQELIAALGGSGNVNYHLSPGTDGVLYWFERGHIARGFGLQALVSLLHRGFTLDRINSKLFGHPKWTSYVVPVVKSQRRAGRGV